MDTAEDTDDQHLGPDAGEDDDDSSNDDEADDDNGEADAADQAESSGGPTKAKPKKRRSKGRKSHKKKSTRETLPDPNFNTSDDICAQLSMTNVAFDYSEDDFDQITSGKVGIGIGEGRELTYIDPPRRPPMMRNFRMSLVGSTIPTLRPPLQ